MRRRQWPVHVVLILLGAVFLVVPAIPALANPKGVGAPCADVDAPALPREQLPGGDPTKTAEPTPAGGRTYYYDYPEYHVDVSPPTAREMATITGPPEDYQ